VSESEIGSRSVRLGELDELDERDEQDQQDQRVAS